MKRNKNPKEQELREFQKKRTTELHNRGKVYGELVHYVGGRFDK